MAPPAPSMGGPVVRQVRASALVAVALLAACGNGNAPVLPDGGPVCGVCPNGTVCDATTKACVSAAGAGQLCGSSVQDGGPTNCVSGTTCGPVATGDNV